MALKDHKQMESKKANGMGSAKASTVAWKILATYLCVAFLGLLAGFIVFFIASNYDLLVSFAISFPSALAIHYSFHLDRDDNGKLSLKWVFLISYLIRLLAVASSLGFTFLFLYMTDKSYMFLFTAPVVLMIGYIAAIVFEGMIGGSAK